MGTSEYWECMELAHSQASAPVCEPLRFQNYNECYSVERVFRKYWV